MSVPKQIHNEIVRSIRDIVTAIVAAVVLAIAYILYAAMSSIVIPYWRELTIATLSALLCLLLAVLYSESRRRPFVRSFPDERLAIDRRNGIRDWLMKLPERSNLHIAGLAVTSILPLFDTYVSLMEKGTTIGVLMLDPSADDIIELIAENEPSRSVAEELKVLVQDLDKITRSIDSTVEKESRDLLTLATNAESKSATRVAVIKACTILWMHARDKARRSNGAAYLRLTYYNQFPLLKIWVDSPPSLCFRGTYLEFPGVGVSNPIWVLSPRRFQDKIIIERILDTISYLSNDSLSRQIDAVEEVEA